jgi:hypothetical protein
MTIMQPEAKQPMDKISELDRAGGTLLFELGSSPLTREQWDSLDELSSPSVVSYERVTLGDAGELNYVDVARFMTDVASPQIVNVHVSKAVMDILCSPQMIAFYERVTGHSNLHVRRCQVNILGVGGFIGTHLDIDSNPDYLSPVVMQFSDDYEGGDYVVYHPTLGEMCFRTRRYSMLISRCDIPHSVSTTTRGRRKTLVFFLSQHDGLNRRWTKEQQPALTGA